MGFRHLQSMLGTRVWLAACAVIAIFASVRLSYGDTIQSFPFEENRRAPITHNDLVGEWSGLTAEQEIFVTLRVDRTGKRAFLALARRTGDTVSTRTYKVNNIQTHDGAFSLGGPGDSVRLEASAQGRFWGAASGRGTLIFHDGVRERQEVLYLFHVRGGSWAQQMLALARTYGLL
jgi:hypothetical protein